MVQSDKCTTRESMDQRLLGINQYSGIVYPATAVGNGEPLLETHTSPGDSSYTAVHFIHLTDYIPDTR